MIYLITVKEILQCFVALDCDNNSEMYLRTWLHEQIATEVN